MMTKCLIYCTKAKPSLYKPFEYDCFEQDEASRFYLSKIPMLKEDTLLNGKIVAQFDCEMVEMFTLDYRGDKEQNKRISKDSCVSIEDLIEYQKDNHFLNAIHISNLEIFEKPKELSEYSKRLPSGDFQVLGKAPQNMMNVCEIKYYIENYILISIKPEWVAKILNGKKTIEVRKKIVNRLKEN